MDKSIIFLNNCIDINIKFINAYLLLGHIFLRTKQFDKAIYYYNKVLELNPKRIKTKFNLAWCYFAKLKINEAFENYEYRKEKLSPKGILKEVLDKFNSDEWSGENLDNKTILILSEQGYGDNINFFRYLFWLYEEYRVKIIYYSHKKLEHIFKNSPFKIITDLKSINNIDYHKHLLSLPGIYYKKYKIFKKNINYINSYENNDQKWENKIKNLKKPLISINWQGDNRYAYDDMRSIPLYYFKNILNLKSLKFISLQKNFGSDQIRLNNFENLLMDFSNEIDVSNNAFEDTISILKKVDCVITSDTAIAHLAGVLNVKTYLLLNYNPDWRWFLELKFKCFYPNMNIIQQNSFGDWNGVFKKLEFELKENFVKNRN